MKKRTKLRNIRNFCFLIVIRSSSIWREGFEIIVERILVCFVSWSPLFSYSEKNILVHIVPWNLYPFKNLLVSFFFCYNDFVILRQG